MSRNNIEIPVDSDDQIYSFLRRNMPNKSKNNIKSLLSNGAIFINDKVITKYDYIVKKGQVVTINNNRVKASNIDIIYEDKDIIVINKKSGLLTIATDDEKEVTAYHFVMEYLKSRNKSARVFIVHRLDKDTSGILVFAKSERMKKLLQDNWNDIVKVRSYLTIVEGVVPKDKGTIRTYLKENKNNMVYSSPKSSDGKLAITNYKKISSNANYSFLEVKIDTGRKNQIRVHMKELGYSVVGDKKYGIKSDPIKRLALHANVLEFVNPVTKKVMHFESKMPECFKKLI